MFKKLDKCLVCKNDDLIEVKDLGLQPLANNLKDADLDPDISFPLVLNVCPKCTHKQLSIAVDPKILFYNYFYQTGTSESHLKFFHNFSRCVKGKSILDIGCNDGSLLSKFEEFGWDVMGVEPSQSFTYLEGTNILRDFFPTKEPINRTFDVITAFNVFAHNDDPCNFLLEMKKLLNKNGRIYILTTPSTLDNIYHEHISYFTPRSMLTLADKCKLQMRSFVESPMHGRSYLFELSEPLENNTPHKDLLMSLYQPVVGYGASAGGTVLLNYFGFKPEYVVDDNHLKQAKYIPGVNVPIYSSQKLFNDPRDLTIIILAHNLYDEIVAKIKRLRPNANDKFVNPMTGTLK